MSHRPLLLAALLALVAGPAGLARADVVRLTSGGAIRGEVVSESRGEVVVRTASGTAVIPRREVESVERDAGGAGAALEAEYRARLAVIDGRDAEARYALGLWLKARGAGPLARREFEATVALDPDHRFAREELGGPSGPRGRATPGATPAALALAARPEVAAALDALRSSSSDEAVADAWRTLDDVEPAAREALAGALREVGRDLRRASERLGRRTRDLTGRYDPASGPDAARARALARWDQARADALALVFGADLALATPTELADRVARARAAWLAVDALQRRDLEGLLALSPADALALRDELVAARGRLVTFAAACAARGLGADAPAPAHEPVIEVLLLRRADEVAPGSDRLGGWDAALVRRLADERVLARDAVALRALDPALRPTPEELEQVRLTNEHRMALGRPALALDLRPIAPAPGRPGDAVVSAAAPAVDDAPRGPAAPGAENTAEGVESARAAHELWVASPPHHRNLLDAAWTVIGVRRDGARWTQRFAAR